MAAITCKINRDAKGNAEVIYTVHRLDPGDEVTLTTDTPNAAVEWEGPPAFGLAAGHKVLMIPQSGDSKVAHKVKKAMPPAATCGEVGSHGKFIAWPGEGFPSSSTETGKLDTN